MNSLLANIPAIQVASEPFPHLVARDLIPDATCLQLINEFPSIDVVTKNAQFASNERFSYGAKDSIPNPLVSDLWREFVAANSSQEFLNQFINLFAEHIRLEYPSFEQDVAPLSDLRAGIRGRDGFDQADIMLDAQICVNTPVVGAASTVRGHHFDLPDKLYAGLFYMRPPHDDSTGGDLELSVFKRGTPGQFKGQFIEEKHVNVVKTVKYERNVLVLFLNSPRALHGVTLRSVTTVPRYFLNLVGEVQHPLFNMDEYQARGGIMNKLAGIVRSRS